MSELDVGLQRATVANTGMHVKAGCCTDGCRRPPAEGTAWCLPCLVRLRGR